MSAESLPVLLVSGFSAILHGLLFVGGFLLIKRARSWLPVMAVTVGMIVVSVAASVVSFSFQGLEQTSKLMFPGGEYFSTVGAPIILRTIISIFVVMLGAYTVFVEPGNQKNV